MTHPPHRRNLLEGDVAPHLRRLALPIMWGLMALGTFSVIDTFFISRLGTGALAALGFTLPAVMFFMGVIFGMSVGVSSVVSRACGEGEWDRVRRLSTDALALTAVIATAAAIVGSLCIDAVFARMGAGPALLPEIGRYMAAWYIGMPFLAVMMISNAIMRATGDTKLPSFIMVSMAALNACLDPCFIFGLGPFPRLGMPGAAVTLATTYVVTCALALYMLAFKRRLVLPTLFHAGSTAAWRRILHVGVPAIASNMISPISAGIITWMAAGIGHETVAALSVAERIEGPALMIFYAMSGGVAIFAGQNFGAGNYGRIQQVVGVASRYALTWGALVAAAFWLLAPLLPHVFTSDARVIADTTLYLCIVPVSYGTMGMMVAANAALNAMGKPLPATVLIFLRTFGLYVPLAFLGRARFGFAGILAALCVTNITIGALSFLWNKRAAR